MRGVFHPPLQSTEYLVLGYSYGTRPHHHTAARTWHPHFNCPELWPVSARRCSSACYSLPFKRLFDPKFGRWNPSQVLPKLWYSCCRSNYPTLEHLGSHWPRSDAEQIVHQSAAQISRILVSISRGTSRREEYSGDDLYLLLHRV